MNDRRKTPYVTENKCRLEDPKHDFSLLTDDTLEIKGTII